MKENTHAYLILGNKSSVTALNKFLEKEWGFKISGNPDYYFFEYETLSIDDARKIKNIASTKPFGEKKIIILTTNFIGGEAQNAMLKTLEEPSADNFVFIIIRSEANLLPTVRSRLLKLDLSQNIEHSVSNILVKDFLKSKASDRLKILNSFLTHESETKKSDLISFLDEIERELSLKALEDIKIRENLTELLELKGYLSERSPSVKMIGEYLALKLPSL
ncbi:MAG: hypothetical protein AAB513_02670 [Patescibacteria group bacterium]